MAKGEPNKRYPAELKKQVVEKMLKEKLGHKETEREFGLTHGLAAAWEQIYLRDGPDGFDIERRGHASKGRPPKAPDKNEEKNLLKEVQRLRAENDYLKKLQALVLEDERRQCKRHR